MVSTRQAGTGASMRGKTVVITGATSGLGAVAAEALAARGARVVLIGRDEARIATAMRRIEAANPGAGHASHQADLSRLGEVRRVAAALASEPRIDVLANNAGAMFGALERTEDGIERTFATNHMAYFVLTLSLREALARTPGARVVNTSSAAHRGVSYDPGDPQALRRFVGWRAYSHSKLANILFTRELARRWKTFGVTANCFHPGVVATRFGDATGGWMSPIIRAVKLFAITPEKGAGTLIYLASAPEVASVSGGYFDRCVAIEPRPPALDDAAARSLWTESLRLAGMPDEG